MSHITKKLSTKTSSLHLASPPRPRGPPARHATVPQLPVLVQLARGPLSQLRGSFAQLWGVEHLPPFPRLLRLRAVGVTWLELELGLGLGLGVGLGLGLGVGLGLGLGLGLAPASLRHSTRHW